MSNGGSHEAKRPRVGRRLRIVMVFLALAALLVPMAYVFAGFWSVTSQEQTNVAAERSGVRYLQPVISLVTVLGQAELAAAAGSAVDAAQVRSAITKVDAADRRYGTLLRTKDRWPHLKRQIDETIKRKTTGHEAYHEYVALTGLMQALVAKVGETSHLTEDPRYGASVTLLRLPSVSADASHAAALLRPTGAEAPSHGGGHKPAPNDHAGESPYAGPGRVAAVLDRISTSREVVREGLRRSGATVEGAGGLAALDEFTAAIGVLVETVSPAAKGGKVPLGDADDASERVRKAVAGLASQMLDAADGQLAEQADAVADKRFYATAAVLVGLLLAVGLLWLSLPGHPEAPAPAPVADPGEEYDAAAEETEPTPELIDARELLNSEELLHVGRAVRSTRGEPDDAH